MKNFKQICRFATFAVASFLLFSCSSDDDAITDEPIGDILPPVILDCNYFKENINIHLTNEPDAPIDYIVDCDPEIDGDFTVDAGVVIAFEDGAGLQLGNHVNGKIQMNGTAEEPIIFTGTQQDKGAWKGIMICSSNSGNKMDYVTIEYGGQETKRGWGLDGSVIGARGGMMKMDHCTVQHGAGHGLHWEGGALDAGKLALSNSTFTGNDIPVHTSVNHINSIDGTSTYIGNVNDYVELRTDNVYQDVTFHKLDVPFFSRGFRPDNEGKRKFTFKPGVTIWMDAGSEINFNNAFSYDHEIVMLGTAEDPITIRGKEQVPGYWNGIRISNTTNPLNEIAFVDIAHAGKTNGHPNGAVLLGSSSIFLNMHDVNFIDCFEYGVSVQSPGAINLNYSNLNLVNTPKLFSDWNGGEISNP